jgi:hypothetical protein
VVFPVWVKGDDLKECKTEMRQTRQNQQMLQEEERLKLILEAVKYCQKVSLLGMPKACYSKALREPIYFLWESYGRKKTQAARYCSESSLACAYGNHDLVYDHAIPFKYIQEELLKIVNPNVDNVKHVLEIYQVACLVTKEEDTLLTSMGLRSRMPTKDGEISCLARYEAAGIKVIANPDYVSNRV